MSIGSLRVPFASCLKSPGNLRVPSQARTHIISWATLEPFIVATRLLNMGRAPRANLTVPSAVVGSHSVLYPAFHELAKFTGQVVRWKNIPRVIHNRTRMPFTAQQ